MLLDHEEDYHFFCTHEATTSTEFLQSGSYFDAVAQFAVRNRLENEFDVLTHTIYQTNKRIYHTGPMARLFFHGAKVTKKYLLIALITIWIISKGT